MNRTTRKITCYTCLKLKFFFNWIVTSKELLLDHQLLLYHQRKAHRLDMIIKHHTSIRTTCIAFKYTILEQYTNQWKRIWNQIYALLWSHRREKHTNRSYDWKDTTTERFALYAEKKTIGFIYFDYIKAYINWVKSNLDSSYKTRLKQIIFYL